MFNIFQYTNGPARIWIGLLLVWTLIWKAIALWKAARKTDKIWYVVMIVLNTAGILEILYIYVFSNRKPKEITAASNTSAIPQQ